LCFFEGDCFSGALDIEIACAGIGIDKSESEDGDIIDDDWWSI